MTKVTINTSIADLLSILGNLSGRSLDNVFLSLSIGDTISFVDIMIVVLVMSLSKSLCFIF
tara:strand:- start:243 stop:425 length:183 start_codon:yes stop_codon:yes gene_type:complete